MESFVFNLKQKYDYDEKIVNALLKVIPVLINYYGDSYKDLILSAINDTCIVCCNSYQTVSKIRQEEVLTSVRGNSQKKDIEGDGAYLSNVEILYDEVNNCYRIDKIKRKIVVSHTFNLDSPKGLEVLILNLIRLIKSYDNEYVIDGNILINKQGICEEYRKISLVNGSIETIFDYENNVGLYFGSLLYDTEQIESIILNDRYDTHQYDYLRLIIRYIKDIFELNDLFNEEEITKNNIFRNIFKDDFSFEEFSNTVDLCLGLEHEMLIYALNREEKDAIEKRLKDAFDNDMIEQLIKLKKIVNKMDNRSQVYDMNPVSWT